MPWTQPKRKGVWVAPVVPVNNGQMPTFNYSSHETGGAWHSGVQRRQMATPLAGPVVQGGHGLVDHSANRGSSLFP